MLSKSEIENVFNNPNPTVQMHAVGRALLVLYKHQTAHEKMVEQTRENNEIGFNSSDAKRGTSMAKFYKNRGYLTERQVNWWLSPTKTRSSRIIKYWRQLSEAAHQKQTRRD